MMMIINYYNYYHHVHLQKENTLKILKLHLLCHIQLHTYMYTHTYLLMTLQNWQDLSPDVDLSSYNYFTNIKLQKKKEKKLAVCNSI